MQDSNRQPLISFVTRTCRRPEYLVENIKSLLMQTDPDWEQILIADNIGRGLLHANGMLFHYRTEIAGRYVYILDDDNRLATDDIVAGLRSVISGEPKLIVCKTKVNDYTMPHPWKEVPFERGGIDSGCYFVRSDLWKQYIGYFCHELAGDYHFIEAIHSAEINQAQDIIWWDKLVSLSMRDRPYGQLSDRMAHEGKEA